VDGRISISIGPFLCLDLEVSNDDILLLYCPRFDLTNLGDLSPVLRRKNGRGSWRGRLTHGGGSMIGIFLAHCA
jgi:hypothetical protein